MLLRTGIALSLGFVLIRVIGLYGDPNPWEAQPAGAAATLMDFLNTTKYPPSLDYLLMTLGPAAILCSLADRFAGPIQRVLTTYGRAPFAFYVSHYLVIHTLSLLLGLAQGFTFGQMATNYRFYPRGFGIHLPGVYAFWVLVVVLLFPFCQWVSDVKARRRDWWLSFV